MFSNHDVLTLLPFDAPYRDACFAAMKKGADTPANTEQMTSVRVLVTLLGKGVGAQRSAWYTYGSEGWGFESCRAHKQLQLLWLIGAERSDN